MDEIVASYDAATDIKAYHYYDASGHCTLLAHWQGHILEQYYYDAFGFPYFYGASGNWLGYSPHGNRFLFTGREWLKDLKLYDFRHRMYQPELGRFLQPDPIQFKAGDYNLYRYCHNDPVNNSDPTGMLGLTSSGDGDWDWFNGGVAMAQIAQTQIVRQAKGFPPVDPQAAYKAAKTVVKDVERAIRTSQETEVGSEVLQTKNGEYIATKVHPGSGITKQNGKWAQSTAITNYDTRRFHLVGYVVGYAHYGSRYAHDDLGNAARNPGIAVAVLVFKYNGRMTVLPYVKPQPIPIPP